MRCKARPVSTAQAVLRVVAERSSHCPWIDNCVGVNNLRHFFLYIMALEIGILLFVRLVIAREYTMVSPWTEFILI
jgi:hypothetical protein